MSLAAYLAAAELRAPFLYLQSEGKHTRLYRYEFDAPGVEPAVDEIAVGLKLLGVVDVDFVVRCANRVGIIEAKTGSGVKKR